ncbi:hypothetical protein RJ55_02873 [Drechmeria coniospora]|nr:hypothetical protein RJ55_02873 [Drechmeria coniospora]
MIGHAVIRSKGFDLAPYLYLYLITYTTPMLAWSSPHSALALPRQPRRRGNAVVVVSTYYLFARRTWSRTSPDPPQCFDLPLVNGHAADDVSISCHRDDLKHEATRPLRIIPLWPCASSSISRSKKGSNAIERPSRDATVFHRCAARKVARPCSRVGGVVRLHTLNVPDPAMFKLRLNARCAV